MLLRERPYLDPTQRRLTTPAKGDKVVVIGNDEDVYTVLEVGSKIYRMRQDSTGLLKSEYKNKCAKWIPPELRNENKTTLINEGKRGSMAEMNDFFLKEDIS